MKSGRYRLELTWGYGRSVRGGTVGGARYCFPFCCIFPFNLGLRSRLFRSLLIPISSDGQKPTLKKPTVQQKQQQRQRDKQKKTTTSARIKSSKNGRHRKCIDCCYLYRDQQPLERKKKNRDGKPEGKEPQVSGENSTEDAVASAHITDRMLATWVCTDCTPPLKTHTRPLINREKGKTTRKKQRNLQQGSKLLYN